MSARKTALDVLIACRQQAAWSNGILKEYVQRDRLDSRDAALATHLCYGVLQNRGYLDFYLKQLLTGKLRDLHPAIRDILHLGLYQILFMDKIPHSAAVNESVDLAKKYCKKQRFAPGLVNGVLRNAVRSKDTLKEPTSLEDRYSHPKELVELLRAYVGEEKLEAMLKANNAAPDMVVQVNTLQVTTQMLTQKLQEEGVTTVAHPWMTDCLILSGVGNIEKLESFQKGLFYVQDAAAKLSVLCAQIPREEHTRVLDCCAAPGGKSFAAAIAMGGKGSITSCDVYPHKTALIEKGAKRLGIQNVSVLCKDAAVHDPQWEAAMDVVLADVPCSGYGIIRKKPDIRYKDLEQMAKLPQLQLQILNNQATYVKPGGVLLYSTCTLSFEENEGVIQKFLNDHPDFNTEKLALPSAFPGNDSGMLCLVPGEYDTDGFFICRLRRKLCNKT